MRIIKSPRDRIALEQNENMAFKAVKTEVHETAIPVIESERMESEPPVCAASEEAESSTEAKTETQEKGAKKGKKKV